MWPNDENYMMDMVGMVDSVDTMDMVDMIDMVDAGRCVMLKCIQS